MPFTDDEFSRIFKYLGYKSPPDPILVVKYILNNQADFADMNKIDTFLADQDGIEKQQRLQQIRNELVTYSDIQLNSAGIQLI